MQPKPPRRLGRLIVVVAIVAIAAIGWTQRYDVYDWWRLRNYNPPAEIAQLATDITLTDHGKKLFYVNRPVLNDEITFQQNCTVGEVTIVLGCYVSGEGIFLFKVEEERLAGVHQVTAAHEMLHAAYERLTGSEKQRIDSLTQKAFEELDNDRIEKTIGSYRQRDPSAVPNELHSILATEVKKLPSELEEYYSQYFEDRKAVVRFSEAYERAFEERQAKVEAYDDQLAVLRDEINQLQADLKAQSSALSAQNQTMDNLLADGRRSEYNALVPVYNQRVNAYNTDAATTRQLISEFNELVAKRNAIALEENELIQAIDSRPSSIPTE